MPPFGTTSADGQKTLVVQAGEFGEFVGCLKVDSNASGAIAGWRGNQVAVVGDNWFRLDNLPDGQGKTMRIEFRKDSGATSIKLQRGNTYVDATPVQAQLLLPKWNNQDKDEADIVVYCAQSGDEENQARPLWPTASVFGITQRWILLVGNTGRLAGLGHSRFVVI